MGQDLSTIVRDLPVEFDLEAARLGDYDRETVIRLFREYEFRSLIERLPAMTGETAGETAEALRSVATDGSVRPRASPVGAALGLGLRAPGPAAIGGRRPPAVARLRCRRASRGRRAGAADGRRRTGAGRAVRRRPSPSSRGPAERTGCRDRRPVAHRGPRRAIGSLRSSRGSPPSRRSGRGSSSTTRGRGAGHRRPRPRRPGWPDRRGRRRRGCRRLARPARAARDARSSGTRSSRCSSLGIGDDPARPTDAVAFDTQIAAYILNAACAASPSPTWSPSSST